MVVESGKKAVLSGVEEKKQFSVTLNNKAFKVLTDNLYADKIGAAIRELSSNAYDAHKEKGNLDIPWKIHVPSPLEPYFSIRDYGSGLSHEQVLSLYTTFFSSTKDQSNDFVGGYGLGSKSPFAYTSNFVVNSYYNGVVTSYAMYLDNGAPTVSLLGSEITEEESGLEIRYSVNSVDFNSFSEKIKLYSEFYNPTPIGVPDLQPATFLVDKIYKSSYQKNGGVIIGKVPYPMSYFPTSMFIELDIGEVEVSVSRETVSMDYSDIIHLSKIIESRIVDAIKDKRLPLSVDLLRYYYKELLSIFQEKKINFLRIKGKQYHNLTQNSKFFFNDLDLSLNQLKRLQGMDNESILLTSKYNYEELLDELSFSEDLLIRVSSIPRAKAERVSRCKTFEDYQNKYKDFFLQKKGWRFESIEDIDFNKRTYCVCSERGSLSPTIRAFFDEICPNAVIIEKSRKNAFRAFPRRIELNDRLMSKIATKRLSKLDKAKVKFCVDYPNSYNSESKLANYRYYDYDLVCKDYDKESYFKFVANHIAETKQNCKYRIENELNNIISVFGTEIVKEVITYEIH